MTKAYTMTQPPTIVAKKQAFLASQTRLLTGPDRPLPSRAWTRSNAASDSPLPPRAVDEALSKLSQMTRQHARRVYAPQTARHVAEQIERLYWEDAEKRTEGVGGDGIDRNADLVDAASISRLPLVWYSEKDTIDHPAEAHRYTAQAARLSSLADERKQRQGRVERLRRMRELLAPFEESLADGGVQESLLTRGGPLERQLEKTRVLLARVSGRILTSESIVVEDEPIGRVVKGERERVDDVLRRL